MADAPIAFDEARNFVVQPLYYAMLMFNIALGGPNSRIYSPRSTGTTPRLKLWAIQNAETNEYTLVVLHKGTGEAATLTVPSPMPGARARSVNMTAPSLTSKTGFAIAGVPINGKTGGFAGRVDVPGYEANGQGQFRFTVAPGSAMVIRFSLDSKQPFIRLQANAKLDAALGSPGPGLDAAGSAPGSTSNAGHREGGWKVLFWNLVALGGAIFLAW